MATENRDLRSGVSVWDPAAFPSQKLTNDIKADALVIGAGVTGALMAESLSKHFSVAVVDRRGAASGSTVASTGLLLFEIDTPLIRLRKKIGRERADRGWRRSDSAMRALMSRVDALAIDCDLARRSSVYLPGTTLDADGLREEAEARAQCGLPSKWIGSGELQDRFGVSREAAIVSDFTAIKMGLYSPAIVLDFVHPFFANRCFVSTGGKRRFNEAGHFPRLCAFDHTRDEAGRRSRRCHLIPRETLVGAGQAGTSQSVRRSSQVSKAALAEGLVTRKNKGEKTKLVGLVEVSLGSGKITTALLFDNMRWVVAVSAPSVPYEIGSTATFIEDDEGDLAIKRAEHLAFGHSSIEKLN